ncbi:MAG: hypothetical protein WDN06_04755 [Asticcacaulis sp.]
MSTTLAMARSGCWNDWSPFQVMATSSPRARSNSRPAMVRAP